MPALARRLTAAAAAAVAVGGVSLASLPTANAATSCRVAWGSAHKAINLSSTVTGTPATAVRTAPRVLRPRRLRAQRPHRRHRRGLRRLVKGPGSHNRIVVDIAHRW